MDRRSWIIILIIAVFVAAAALVISTRNPDTGAAEQTTTTPTTPASTTTTIEPPTTLVASTTPTSATTLPPSTLAAGTSVCDRYQEITPAGAVESPALVEVSGIAGSRLAPGVVWAHNDSGDDPLLHAVGPDGEDVGRVGIEGGIAFDWEDMAAGSGPEPGSSYLYIGDIGDNFGIRQGRVTVYRVLEPDPAALPDVVPVDEVIVLDTPDGPRDFESLFVADGSLYLVTKEDPIGVYRAAGSGDSAVELIATIELGAQVTGADVSWDGSTIAFRGYQHVWMWHRSDGQAIEDALQGTPCAAPSPEEPQGEAIAFIDSGGFVTLSEGESPVLFVVPAAP